ncbi:MAG TPA: hypothetical protein VK281_02065 [Xanthobacteraceae bacterium]|nr:hypothetical protein [Xanthobacteraceae bacterium]
MKDAIVPSDCAGRAKEPVLSALPGFLLAAASVTAALGLTLLIRRATDNPTLFVFYAAIFISFSFAGRGPALLALAFSCLALQAVLAGASAPITRDT